MSESLKLDRSQQLHDLLIVAIALGVILNPLNTTTMITVALPCYTK